MIFFVEIKPQFDNVFTRLKIKSICYQRFIFMRIQGLNIHHHHHPE